MIFRPAAALLLIAASGLSLHARCAQVVDIGLSASGKRIDALVVEATATPHRTLALVGLSTNDTAAVRNAVAAYEARRDRKVRLLAVPLVNPDGRTLQFPPTGTAYRDHPESHALWRWLGAQAPDLVLVAGDATALVAALGSSDVAGMGHLPAQRWNATTGLAMHPDGITASEARSELLARRARSPRQLAEMLSRHYGRDFEQPWYIGAIALMARLRLGEQADVQRLAEPWVDGSRDSLARPNSLVMAGHILFTDLARRTGDARYVAAVRKVAELGFDASGNMLAAMPYHDGYSDSVFMGAAIVAQAGSLTGERRYFDMADRHLRFMEGLDLRPDGLYRHRPEADVAWGRGNGFAALGLAMVLTEMPRDHTGHAHALQSYRNLMAALLPLQTVDGLWRNVLNHPGAYAEFSATAMIGYAMKRGLINGWINGRDYESAVDRAWIAVNSRTSSTGGFIDVCDSTARFTTLQDYLHRPALLGNDPRGGAMALLFATELMEKP